MSEKDRGRIRRLKQKIWLLIKRRSNLKLKLRNDPQLAGEILVNETKEVSKTLNNNNKDKTDLASSIN